MRAALVLIILSATLTVAVWVNTAHDWVKPICAVILACVALAAYAFATAPLEKE